jgi:hypothetical protein
VAELLRENDWTLLLRRLKDGRCTPFLGAGAAYGALPLGADIARDWAEKYGYPFEDSTDLVRVAQYVAIEYDGTYPKDLIRERFATAVPPDFHAPDEPHGLLADLKLPIYLTTNYDDFMARALADRKSDPRRELCRWNDRLQGIPSVFETEPGYKPTPANPIVFHLHGMLRVAEREIAHSVVLTEDDYLEFLSNMVRNDAALIPPAVREALTNSSLLFIGYRLADWNFRVLYQSLRSISKFSGWVVMKPPGGANEQKIVDFYREQYSAMDLKVYWGTAREFSAELRRRMT